MPNKKSRPRHPQRPEILPPASAAERAVLPLGAMMFAASVNAWAQSTPAAGEATLKPVVVTERAEEAEGKDALRATTTTIGKGKQELRDIPQSITVVTEKLLDERHIDTVKEALKNTAGITFQAAEGGEEDIRLRGFPLAQSGDLYVDGIRDPAFYDRDTFNMDRVEVLRGSASMLFGRGSTGGAVNQVNKVPRLVDENQVDVSVGSYDYYRVVADFNKVTGENAALRLSLMHTQADNNGAGSSIDKQGVAGAFRWGIGTADEFQLSFFHLDNNNGINYGMPWIRPKLSSPLAKTTLLPVDPDTYYGADSDYNDGSASYQTASYIHRFSSDTELKTVIRKGYYERDQRAGAIRFAGAGLQPGGQAVSLATLSDATVLTRGNHLKIQNMDTLHVQSDLSTKFAAAGFKHEVLAGIDFAQEEKTVYGARSAAQGGVTIVKPTTTIGNPDDGAWVSEGSRVLRTTSDFESKAWGIYAQDLIHLNPYWKVVAGLRWDGMHGDYNTYSIPNNAPGPVTTTSYEQSIYKWSERVGVLFQPNAYQSYHVSWGTSFNTSGDTYSYSAATVDTPPEESRNIEIGAKLDSEDRRFSNRFAWFRSTKFNERNTDPLLNIAVLTGKRHATGMEWDFSGYLTPKWEVYGSYMWMPFAVVDEGAESGEDEGERPSLTPKHSGTVWSTYQFLPQLRAGAGVNFRSKQKPVRNPGWYAAGFATVDLMAEYTLPSEKVVLKANVSNVFDKLYADQLYPGHYVPGMGRLLTLTASMKF
jgi:catecholate siderophore receptor